METNLRSRQLLGKKVRASQRKVPRGPLTGEGGCIQIDVATRGLQILSDVKVWKRKTWQKKRLTHMKGYGVMRLETIVLEVSKVDGLEILLCQNLREERMAGKQS